MSDPGHASINHTNDTEPLVDPGPYVHGEHWSGHPLINWSWQESGACASTDPDLYVPPDGVGLGNYDSRKAKKVCAKCPVKTACEAYALETREKYGVWGDTSADERHKILGAWKEEFGWGATEEDATDSSWNIQEAA